jgi:hypothetical protein
MARKQNNDILIWAGLAAAGYYLYKHQQPAAAAPAVAAPAAATLEAAVTTSGLLPSAFDYVNPYAQSITIV